MTARRCTRCGEGFILDAPAKGRRLCDACRAKRATFFTCLGCGAEREVRSATRDAERRPVQCWDCRQVGLDAARMLTIVEHVAGIEPTLPHAVIRAAIEEAAPSRVERKWLAEHLGDHPAALASEASDAPRAVCRLAAALVAAGSSTNQPRCARCGAASLLVRTVAESERICGRCDTAGRAVPCSACGRVRKVSKRTAQGRAMWNSCRLRDPTSWKIREVTPR